MSGEKTRKIETLAKLFQALRSRTICWQDYRTRYLKLEHPAGMKEWADELRKLATANIALHLVLTKTLVRNLNDKEAYPQVCIDVGLLQ